MSKLFHAHSPYRIFGFSVVATAIAIIGTWLGMGSTAALLVTFLMIIEIVFSFENAIINAKVLQRLSRFWQMIFLTVGILVAVFGMRVVFPILVVVVTAQLPWGEVITMALQNPAQYAENLHHAQPLIAAFGGSFLLTLALYFFTDRSRNTYWWGKFERSMQRSPEHWAAPALASLVVLVVALLPANERVGEVMLYGFVGIAIYVGLYALTHFLEKHHKETEKHRVKKAMGLTGWAAFTSFMYLEVLDASFSFDGVIGAFAITSNVVLIAIGLGIGAIWVRSLTIFMIRRGTLHAYKYLEHGAHYTVFALALTMFVSIYLHIPEWLAGGVGVILITSSILASRKLNKAQALSNTTP